MKRALIITFLLSMNICFAGYEELSKQATAFYSDNNRIKTMDLILQISDKDRSAQDWLLLGNVLADNGKTEDALYMYKKAIEKDKKCYKAYYNIGNYYMEKGQYDKAAECYEKAVKIKGDNAYIFYNLGCAYLKQNNLTKARANFNKALMYNSNLSELHYNLAYIYKQLGKEKLAQTYLNNYISIIHAN